MRSVLNLLQPASEIQATKFSHKPQSADLIRSRSVFVPYVYILKCANGSYYTGSTPDLERRLWEHQNGLGANHTRKHGPVKLGYCEECERIDDAYAREKQIQGWSRRKKQALIAGVLGRLPGLAACTNATRSAGRDESAKSAEQTVP